MSKAVHTEHKHQDPIKEFHASFNKTAPQRAALTTGELISINADVQVVATTVMVAVSTLEIIRPEIVEQLPKFDIHRFDSLGTLGEALMYANTGYTSASQPLEQLPALQARALEIRDQLLVDTTALAKRGLIDGRPLEGLNRGPGYMNMTADLGTLMRITRDNWDKIEGKTAIQLAELDEAEDLFQRITKAYVDRQKISAAVTAAAEERQRAFTLVVRAYEDARRAVLYLRPKEGELEKIAPSLYASRGNRHASTSGSEDPANPVDANHATPAPDHTGVSVTPVHGADPAVSPAPVATAHAAAPGVPSGNPFTN